MESAESMMMHDVTPRVYDPAAIESWVYPKLQERRQLSMHIHLDEEHSTRDAALSRMLFPFVLTRSRTAESRDANAHLVLAWQSTYFPQDKRDADLTHDLAWRPPLYDRATATYRLMNVLAWEPQALAMILRTTDVIVRASSSPSPSPAPGLSPDPGMSSTSERAAEMLKTFTTSWKVGAVDELRTAVSFLNESASHIPEPPKQLDSRHSPSNTTKHILLSHEVRFSDVPRQDDPDTCLREIAFAGEDGRQRRFTARDAKHDMLRMISVIQEASATQKQEQQVGGDQKACYDIIALMVHLLSELGARDVSLVKADVLAEVVRSRGFDITPEAFASKFAALAARMSVDELMLHSLRVLDEEKCPVMSKEDMLARAGMKSLQTHLSVVAQLSRPGRYEIATFPGSGILLLHDTAERVDNWFRAYLTVTYIRNGRLISEEDASKLLVFGKHILPAGVAKHETNRMLEILKTLPLVGRAVSWTLDLNIWHIAAIQVAAVIINAALCFGTTMATVSTIGTIGIGPAMMSFVWMNMGSLLQTVWTLAGSILSTRDTAVTGIVIGVMNLLFGGFGSKIEFMLRNASPVLDNVMSKLFPYREWSRTVAWAPFLLSFVGTTFFAGGSTVATVGSWMTGVSTEGISSAIMTTGTVASVLQWVRLYISHIPVLSDIVALLTPAFLPDHASFSTEGLISRMSSLSTPVVIQYLVPMLCNFINLTGKVLAYFAGDSTLVQQVGVTISIEVMGKLSTWCSYLSKVLYGLLKVLGVVSPIYTVIMSLLHAINRFLPASMKFLPSDDWSCVKALSKHGPWINGWAKTIQHPTDPSRVAVHESIDSIDIRNIYSGSQVSGSAGSWLGV